MYPCAAVEHSYNCMVLLCSLFLWPSGHYTKITNNAIICNLGIIHINYEKFRPARAFYYR